ncbi:MAG: fructosamine kinase family protein [Dysgonamonadaceae bacterium]|jgi:fructosamine-3-kinase|nr:fructosamine kinase family protein [Dysgonamonadaceae bacterium]MDD3355664.1 fructosamine kinase family protein [Dysgonamonadaceae bacterium]
MKKLISHISHLTNKEFHNIQSVSGGSISSAFVLKTDDGAYFLKVNSQPDAYEMFVAEKTGLKTIEDTKTIAVPKVHLVNRYEGKSFLLMDYVESKHADPKDLKLLGSQLTHLHLNTADEFGFTSNNFIGSLPQSNNQHASWPDFYWHERILPQLKLAEQKNLLNSKEIIAEQVALKVFEKLLDNDVKPSLVHGDLWGGNYLIAVDGTPYLIDPAVYYGHSMVDIAMSKLFGGFGNDFYSAYHDIIPKTDYYNAQIDLYQLYFLLVHLNLFGRSYYGSVASIMKRYF